MLNQGKVFQGLFSLNLAPANEVFSSDYIDFGEIVVKEIRKNTELEWLNVDLGTKLWTAPTTAVRFGNNTVEGYAFTTPYRGVFDSTSSFIRIPRSVSEYFLTKVTETANAFSQDGWITVACGDEQLPPIYFLVAGWWVEANPADYAIDISVAQDRSLCGIAISENNEDEIAFGIPLLRGFYAIFDIDGGRLGLAPSTLSTKIALAPGLLPTQ